MSVTQQIVFALLLTGMVSIDTAKAQDRGQIGRCLSIQDIDERVDCLESGGARPGVSAPSLRPGAATTGPSFDCRAATLSIERAICGDQTLSEWDARMMLQYQQALRSRKGSEIQSLVEAQRLWIQRRNGACSGIPGTAIWSCILEMTKQRIAALSNPARPTDTPNLTSQPSSTLLPRGQDVATSSQPPAPQNGPATTVVPNSNSSPANPTSEGTNPLLLVIFVLGAIIGGITVGNSIRRRTLRQSLIAKYGEGIANRILARQIWQGMTGEQLVDSWGAPADRDHEIMKSKTKETWKYQQYGRNRFRNRVFLENGMVVGWKQ
ncbi:MAG TPA: lysozyme inhibitor LprI family protein [Rhodopseudomonas sp.]|uniref:lysozyme inhibitor LprI family protein n=1 Tax=Rhodopseudomonas sp. TaxID=1078 RepID=UPI002EDA0A3F